MGRGATWGDLDNDGDIDLVIVNLNDYPRTLRNDGGNRNHWLTIEPLLKFPTGSRLAIGARVIVTTGSLKQIEDVYPVRGHLSQGDGRVHFKLSGEESADVENRWPDGSAQQFPALKTNQFVKYVHETNAAAAKADGAKR